MNTKYDTFWPRLCADLLDGLLFLPLRIAQGFLLTFRFNFNEPFMIVWGFVYIFSRPLYIILMHGRYGQTLGKMVMGVIVLHVNEHRTINYKEAAIREAPYWIVTVFYFVMTVCHELFPHIANQPAIMTVYRILGYANLIWFLLEIITMLTNGKRRALHDYLAHSVVIRKEYLIPQVPLLEMEEETDYQHH